MAWRAARSTAPRAQPPPIQPPLMVPSARITALAPAFAAVAATVRTTVAIAKDSPLALTELTRSRISGARVMSDLRQIRLQRFETREIMRGTEEIDIGQGRAHSSRDRRVIAPADHRIEPGDLPAAAAQCRHFRAQVFGRAGVVAVGHDHDAGARVYDAPGVPAVEGGEAFADARAAADARRNQGQPFHRALRVALAQSLRNMNQPCVEHIGV